jgi:hypothetical protein
MIIVKPVHKRYAFNNLTSTDYTDLACKYSACKRYGFRGIVAFATGTGTLGVVKSVLKGHLVQYGKRRVVGVFLTGVTYICAPAIAVLTNATRVVRCCKIVFNVVGWGLEAAEDVGTLVFLPVDLVLFGQPIPTGKSNRFSEWDRIEDIIAELPRTNITIDE